MPDVSTTRMAMLELKQRLELTLQGRELLEQKRAALMQEMMHVADVVMEAEATLKETADSARLALARAEGVVGFERVLSAALAAPDEFNLKIERLNLMGVRVPRIGSALAVRSVQNRGFAITGTSTLIDEVAEAFEEEVEAIVRLADQELRLRSLLDEIQRTSRRLNALDNVVIPHMQKDITSIQTALDERERADNFRLKLAKRLIERRRSVT